MRKKPFIFDFFDKVLFLIFSKKKQQPITELEKFSTSSKEKAFNGQEFSVNEPLIIIFSSDSCKE